MIRIRPGRSWKENPAYAAELSSSAFDAGRILDVLGIEVDGVDIAAGVGEGRVLLAVDELSQALLRIGDGEPAAQATIGPGPAELVIEARGEDLLLSLVSLAPPARVVASGLLVDAQKMRQAVMHAARGLLLDLLALSPQLSDSPLAQRLSASSSQLARRPLREPRKFPSRSAAGVTRAFKPPKGSEQLSLQLPADTVARLSARRDVPHAPLAAHLGPGTLSLSRKGAPGLIAEGPPLLLLRNLLEEAERLVEAWESSAESLEMHFGPHQLSWSLQAGEVRASGWRSPAKLSPLRFAALVAQAAKAYCDVPLRRVARAASPGDELGSDLRDRAQHLARHVRDLQSGDLRRSSDLSPPPAPRPPQGPLAPRIRRLVHRESWRAPAWRILPSLRGPVLIELPGRLEARHAQTGEVIFGEEAAPGAAERGGDVFYGEPGESLVCVEAATGEVRWKRRLRGASQPGAIWPLQRGVLRALPGEGVALINYAGALVFRSRLPGGAPSLCIETKHAFACALPGFCAGLDPSSGEPIWKRRAQVLELLACGPHVLCLDSKMLTCLDPEGGHPVWRVPAPEGARELTIFGESALLLGLNRLHSFSLHDGSERPAREVAQVAHLRATNEPDALIVTGAACARLDSPKWTIEGKCGAPQLQRGVVLLPRARNDFFELESGLPLASLPPGEPLLRDDLSCAISKDGEVAMHSLATHLSLL